MLKTLMEMHPNTTGKETLKNGEEHTEYRLNFTKMLEEFETVRDVYLARIKVAKHRIDVEPSNRRAIHSTPYHSGPNARKFDPEVVKRMLAQKVIKPAQTK